MKQKKLFRSAAALFTAATLLVSMLMLQMSASAAETIESPAFPQYIYRTLTMPIQQRSELEAYICIASNVFAPEDASKAEYLEMDLYVDDYEKFSKANANTGGIPGLFVHLFSGATKKQTEIGVHEYVTKTGWNHVKLALADGMAALNPNGAALDMTMFRGYEFGPWDAYKGTFAIANVCLTTEELTAPAAPSHIAGEAEMTVTKFTNAKVAVSKDLTSSPLNVQNAKYFVMNFYVDNYAEFEQAYKGASDDATNKTLRLNLFTSGGNALAIPLRSSITSTGWNRIKIGMPEGIDPSAVTKIILQSTVVYTGTVATANICFTELAAITKPAPAEKITKELDTELHIFESLQKYQDLNSNTFAAEDDSAGGFIEMDLFVDDVAEFKIANAGKVVGIYLHLYSGEKNDMTEIALHDSIITDGWNHVRIMIPDGVNMKEFRGFAVGPWDDYNGRLAIANVSLTEKEFIPDKPEMPDEVLLTIDEAGFAYAGWNGELTFHKYEEWNANPLDISNFGYVQMDLYINDADFETYQKEGGNIGFAIGTGEGFWDNRAVYQGKLNPTKAGWNHFKIKIEDFTYPDLGDPNFTTMRRFVLYHESMDGQTIAVHFANICMTAKLSEPDPDPEQAVKPDVGTYYLSDCETLFSSQGSWNPSGVVLDNKNRTEGKTSIMNVFTNQPNNSNSLRYTTEKLLDLSKADSIRFDLFISNELIKNKAQMEIRLSTDSKGFSNYIAMPIDMAALHAGWNAFDFKLSDMAPSGECNMTRICTFGIYTTDSGFMDEDEVKVKLDNIRLTGTVKESTSSSASLSDDDLFSNLFGDLMGDSLLTSPTGDTSTPAGAILLSVISLAVCGLIGYRIKRTKTRK